MKKHVLTREGMTSFISENRVLIILMLLSIMSVSLLALLIIGSNFDRSAILSAMLIVLISVVVSYFINFHYLDFPEEKDGARSD